MKAWEEFLALQEQELGAEAVDKWLKPLTVLRFDAGNLYLEAKDSFQAIWFEEHVRPKITASFVNQNRRKIKVHLSIAALPIKPKGRSVREKAPPPRQAPLQKQFKLNFDTLDPLLTFDHFVPNESAGIILKVLQEAILTKEPVYNPIFIYGNPGSGKTHMLMAMTHALCEKGDKALYLRAETFTENLIGAIRVGEMNAFREAYRKIDALLIDDVHVFSKKGATQEELFHTFNALHLAGKQIILSANCHPRELQGIEPRLISRFEWGLVLSVDVLEENQRKELLEKKAKAMNFPLHPKVLQFLLETFTRGPSALMRALEALILRSHLHSDRGNISFVSLTVPLAKHYLADIIAEEEHFAITPQKVIQALAEYYGMRIEDIMGKAQSRDCSLSRQIAMWICRSTLKMPFTKIGELFDRDHSTVITSVKAIQKEMDKTGSEVANSVGKILKKLQRTPVIESEHGT